MTSEFRKHYLEEQFPLHSVHKRTKCELERSYPIFSKTIPPEKTKDRKRHLEPMENEWMNAGKKLCCERIEPSNFEESKQWMNVEEKHVGIEQQYKEPQEISTEFNDWNFWKTPLPSIEIEETFVIPIEVEDFEELNAQTSRKRQRDGD